KSYLVWLHEATPRKEKLACVLLQRIRVFRQAAAGPDSINLDQDLPDDLGVEQQVGMLDFEGPEVEEKREKSQGGMHEPGPFLELRASAGGGGGDGDEHGEQGGWKGRSFQFPGQVRPGFVGQVIGQADFLDPAPGAQKIGKDDAMNEQN